MILLFRIFLLFVSSIILCQAVIIPVIYGNYLFEFCTYGIDFTTVMANRWSVSRDLTGQPKISSCNSDLIFGGYGILRGGDTISRTYDSLPSHGMVTFSIFIAIIESWQTTNSMSLWVDSNPTFNFSPQELLTKTGAPSAHDCSGTRVVTYAFLVGRLPHSSSTLTFKLSSTTNTQGYYGIKDVIVLFTPYNSSGPTGIYLMTKNENSGVAGALYCSLWKYKDSNNVCQPCHSNCNKCFGPGQNECYACGLHSTYDVALGKCVSCAFGCMQCSGTLSNKCIVCKHQDGFVLDYDHICRTRCTSPYVEDNAGNSEGIFCREACPNPSHFRLIDDTCVSSCPAPLVQRISRDSKGRFCDSPCGQSSINYYYWNTSCKSTCPFLSRTQNGYNFCGACTNSQFMYENGSCQATCSSLFNVNTVQGYKFCDFKCGRFSTDYYYTADASCHSTCPFYSKNVDNFKFCYACPTGQFLHSNYSCKSNCHPSFNVIDIQGYKFCEFKCGRFSTDYYYTVDASCHSTCPFYSRIEDDFKFCYACPTGKFLHSNYSCESSCNYPFNLIDIQGYKFCEFPCGRDSTDFYHWDGTCSSTCSYYNRTTDGYNFCDACSPGLFLHPNSSCETSCPSPYKTRNENGSMFCDYPCQANEYFYWNHTCKSSCDSPNLKQTLYFDYCKTPCQQSDEYMFKNNSCSATCPTPLVAVTEVDAKFCDFPCGRLSNDYYYWNTSCNSTCPFDSRNTDGYNFCDVCLGGTFMHSNHSCENDCAFPFNTLVVEGYKFCEFPCGRYSTNFYFWDGTCSITCSYYSRTTDEYNFCDACSPGLFMHPNSSCEGSCNYPYKTRNENGSMFCDYPCQANEYFYWNHTCKSNCDSPNVKQTLYFDYCKTPCQQSDEYMFKNNSCSATCPTPLVTVTEVDAKFCDFPCGRFSNDYYYWNTSCNSICPFYSRNTDGYNFCDVCLEGSFMHSNHSCETGCAFPFNTLVVEGYKFCDFPCGRFSTDYYYWNTSCKSTCLFSSRTTDGFHFCDACSPGLFMHPNMSCETSCNYPYKNRTQGGSLLCDYPCQTNEYFYWNHTCRSSCDSPNLMQTLYFDYCKTPCQQSAQYMFKNDSCSATCPALLVPITEVDAKFCDFPCGRFSNDYYYWNTSCNSTCPFYSRNTDGYNFCDACLGGKFMHSNRSCETGCAFPFNMLVVEGYKFCDFPCGRFSTDYYYWNTSCKSSCLFYSRTIDEFRFCDACPFGSGLFMHPNTSCLVNCTFPYKSRTQGGSLLCDYPCQTGEYFYWDYTCRPSCGFPLVKQTLYFDYCETPCQQSDNYMLWDNSCSDSCLEPLVIRVENKGKFCDSPCGRTSTDFLYWNGSCIATCPYYQRNANGYIFCDACQPGYFMYPNTTCQSRCHLPYILKNQGGSQFCLYPCEKAKGEFYYPVQRQCLSSCKYPYQMLDEIFCFLIIPKEKSSVLQKIAEFLSGSDTITSSVGQSVGFFNFRNPFVLFSQLFPGMLNYMKYTSIKFPPHLQYIYDADIETLFQIIPVIPEAIKEELPDRLLPDNFKKYNLHSSFFFNFWDPFVTLLCIFISIILVVIMGLLTKSCSSIQSFCNNIKKMLKWNFFLTMFTSYFGDIMFFSSFEFRTISFENVFPIISFVLSLITKILVILVFIKMITVIITRRKLKTQKDINSRAQRVKKEALLKSLAGFEVMFEGSRDSTVMQQAFMFLFIGRYFLYTGIVAYLYQYSLVQTSIICFMSTSMLIYLLFVRPMKTIVDFLQYLLEEVIMLVCTICFLILSVYDELQYEENDTREILGEVIIIAMLVLNGLSALYILIQLLGTLREVYRTIVTWCNKSKDLENARSGAHDIEWQTAGSKLPIKPKNTRSVWRAREKGLKVLDIKQDEEKNRNHLSTKREREERVQAINFLEGRRIIERALKKPFGIMAMNNRNLN